MNQTFLTTIFSKLFTFICRILRKCNSLSQKKKENHVCFLGLKLSFSDYLTSHEYTITQEWSSTGFFVFYLFYKLSLAMFCRPEMYENTREKQSLILKKKKVQSYNFSG